jgi:cell division protein FtsB
MDKEIQLADCLASALLTERSMNIDALFFCVSELKKASDYPMTDLSRYRKNYEPQIRELLKDAFLSVFGHEFVRRDDYSQLQIQNETLSEKIKTLETENINTAAENDRLSDEVKKLKEDNECLTEKIERIVETYEESGDRDLKFGFSTKQTK